MLTALEICAGAGGQALGLEQAGFRHLALVEIDQHACETLRLHWEHQIVVQQDIVQFRAHRYRGGVDLFAGGVPCPPFSKAGLQLGEDDERDLFPEALRLIGECRPRAVMLENVPGLLDERFRLYRHSITHRLVTMGYRASESSWHKVHACDYGVPQLRPRVLLVCFRQDVNASFAWPKPRTAPPITIGKALLPLMASNGWVGATEWAGKANGVAPTLVGGSKKHGGPDLGPTRARQAWAQLGVNGKSIADSPPPPDFSGVPRLTLEMAAVTQGFPNGWTFAGKKTPAYRQIGNAFPPPVATAVGKAVRRTLLEDEVSPQLALPLEAFAVAAG